MSTHFQNWKFRNAIFVEAHHSGMQIVEKIKYKTVATIRQVNMYKKRNAPFVSKLQSSICINGLYVIYIVYDIVDISIRQPRKNSWYGIHQIFVVFVAASKRHHWVNREIAFHENLRVPKKPMVILWSYKNISEGI